MKQFPPDEEMSGAVQAAYPQYCLALHGNHDEHQCHLKPGHEDVPEAPGGRDDTHVCYCGVWW